MTKQRSSTQPLALQSTNHHSTFKTTPAAMSHTENQGIPRSRTGSAEGPRQTYPSLHLTNANIHIQAQLDLEQPRQLVQEPLSFLPQVQIPMATTSQMTPSPPLPKNPMLPSYSISRSSDSHPTSSTLSKRLGDFQISASTLEEDGFVPASERAGSAAPRKLSVLLMGATGAGKSSLIATVTGSNVKIGNSVKPCTVVCSGWDYAYDSNTTITMIDTPGFNDLNRPDMEVLDTIVQFIFAASCPPIAAIIYLHSINEPRITGSMRLNLSVMQAMCGEHFLQNVVLISTMWNSVPDNALPQLFVREEQLLDPKSFLGAMMQKGAKYVRYEGGPESGRDVLSKCTKLTSVPEMKIIMELRDGVTLEDTLAGRILTEELRKREERKRLDQQEEEAAENIRLQYERDHLVDSLTEATEGVRREYGGLEYDRPDRMPQQDRWRRMNERQRRQPQWNENAQRYNSSDADERTEARKRHEHRGQREQHGLKGIVDDMVSDVVSAFSRRDRGSGR